MTSFFNLNVSDAFNNVSHIQLLHNMKKKRMSSRLLKWIKNFLKNKNITLIIEKYTQTKRITNVDISQNLSFSSILYLFYITNLLKACGDVKLRFNFIEFVDDINILMYNEYIKQNCEILKKIWNKTVEWIKQHNFKFNEWKHELIYFTKILKKYNVNVDITLSEHQININIDLRILKVQLNFKLRWKFHLRQIETKLINRHNATNMIENFI